MAVNFCVGQQLTRSGLQTYQLDAINPAIVGYTNFGKAQLTVREQFLGFNDNSGPSSVWLNTSVPIQKINSGVGLHIQKLSQGFENRLEFKGSYAYHIKAQNYNAGIGLSFGTKTIGWDIKNPIYPDGGSDIFIDNKIANTENFTNIFVGLGVYIKTKNVLGAFSIVDINEPKLKTEGQKTTYYNRTYCATVGYEYTTSNPLWKIKPNTHIKTTLKTTQAAIDLHAEYKKFLITGITYTTNNDISPVIGIKFEDGSKFDGFQAIISYDIIGSKIRRYSSGNMEVTAIYNFNLSIEKENKSYKSVRFL